MTARLLDARVWLVLGVYLTTITCLRSLDDTKVRCTTSDHCPSNFVCYAGSCVRGTGGTIRDAAEQADASQLGGAVGTTPLIGGSQGSGGIAVPADGQAATDVAATGGSVETDAAVDAPSTGGVVDGGGVVGSGGQGAVTSTGGSITAECSPGAHSCSDNSLLTCDRDGRWPTTGTPCTHVCRDNACTGQCNPGDNSCSGDTLLTCDANGNWPTTGSACTYVCRSNACTGQCKPTQTTCSGDSLLTCDANGNWPTTGSACSYVCRNNACTGQCKPTQATCNENTLYRCDSNGNWPTTGIACGASYVCNSTSTPPMCQCRLTQCGDGRCLDTSADPMNCGACDHACPGQCASGACQCATQNPSNLVVNGGFDNSVASWSPVDSDLTVAFSTFDASDCGSSGSLFVTYTGPLDSTDSPFGKCMVVSASTTYNMGGWLYSPSGHDRCSGSISVDWYSDANCSSPISTGFVSVYASETCDVWKYLHKESVVPPSGTVSARIYPWVDRVTAGAPPAVAYYDSLYLTPTPGRF